MSVANGEEPQGTALADERSIHLHVDSLRRPQHPRRLWGNLRQPMIEPTIARIALEPTTRCNETTGEPIGKIETTVVWHHTSSSRIGGIATLEDDHCVDEIQASVAEIANWK